MDASAFFKKTMKQETDPAWPELFDRIPLGVMALDLKEERISFCNPAMERMLAAIRPLTFAAVKEFFARAGRPA